MLRTHAKTGSQSVTAYDARTTNICLKAYANFSIDTKLSLSVNHVVVRLAETIARNYILHDCACLSYIWQIFVQISHTCKGFAFCCSTYVLQPPSQRIPTPARSPSINARSSLLKVLLLPCNNKVQKISVQNCAHYFYNNNLRARELILILNPATKFCSDR